MGREEFVACLLSEIEGLVAKGVATRLLVLLPKKLRVTAILSKSCYAAEEVLDEGLRACQEVSLECRCCICTGKVPKGTTALPADHRCFSSKGQMLMNVLAKLASEFDLSRYSPGDITRIVVARHAAACRAHAAKRAAVRREIAENKRVADMLMHQQASRKKTLRLEYLRETMGQEAFQEMVRSQLLARRSRGDADEESQRWYQTEDWWYSEEGQAYWHAPPPPRDDLVMDRLVSRHDQLFPGSWLPGWGGDASPAAPLVLEVPKELVPKLVLKTLDWLQARELPDHTFKCFLAGRVDFAREDGERVPSVHIASKRGPNRNSDLLLLDAASLENLRPGDVVVPRRILEVNGRVVGTVGWEDIELRGINPPSSHLAVAWDLTNCLSEVSLHVVWSEEPQEVAVTIRGSLDAQTTLEEASESIQSLLEAQHASSLAQLLLRRESQRWWADQLCLVQQRLWHLVRPCYHGLQTAGRAVQDYVLHPCWLGLRRLASQAWSLTERPRGWCGDALTIASSRLQSLFGHVLAWLGRSCSRLADVLAEADRALWRRTEGARRCAGQALSSIGTALQGLGSSLSCWWASRPWPRRAGIFLAEYFHQAVVAAGTWWASRPWPRRALVAMGDEAGKVMELLQEHAVDPAARALARFGSCLAALGRKACHWLCPPREPVRLARVRRHDDRNALI